MYCTFDLRGHPVTVAVRRLEADERVRLAAEIAWYAAGLIGCEPFPPAGWPDLLDRIFTNDVAVSCSEVLWEGSRQISGRDCLPRLRGLCYCQSARSGTHAASPAASGGRIVTSASLL